MNLMFVPHHALFNVLSEMGYMDKTRLERWIHMDTNVDKLFYFWITLYPQMAASHRARIRAWLGVHYKHAANIMDEFTEAEWIQAMRAVLDMRSIVPLTDYNTL